jgi:hypothetical protein
VFLIPKTPESVLLVRGGVGAELIWVCFGFQKTTESVLLVKGESKQNGFVCFGSQKPAYVLLAKKWNRSRPDLGVFRIPKTPESVLFVKRERGSEQNGLGVFRIAKTVRIRFARKRGIGAERIWVCFGSQKHPNPYCS